MEWEHNCCLCWKHSLLARIDWADGDDGNYVPKDFLRSACVATKLLPWSLFWAELNRFQSVPLPTLPRKSSKELYPWNWERRPIRVESWLPNGESRHGWAAKHELVDLNSKFGAQLLDDLFSLLYSVELQAVCRCLLKLKYHGYFNKPSFLFINNEHYYMLSIPLMNSNWGKRRGAWQVHANFRANSGPLASKQIQPLSKALPEFRSPRLFLALPVDGVLRWDNFTATVASLLDRWWVFLTACRVEKQIEKNKR